MVTVVPRSGDAATTGALLATDGAEEATGADAAGAEALAGAAASTSSRRIRPPTPVPETFARLTPRSFASLRTIGVT